MNIFDRSLLKIRNGLPYFEIPEITQLEWIRHGFLTRKGGNSSPPYDSLNLSENNGDREEHVSGNKNLIAQTFEFDLNRLILLHQVHQDQIFLVKGPALSLPSHLEYDAQMTNASNIFLGILTADVPIFVADQKKKQLPHPCRETGTTLHIPPSSEEDEGTFGCYEDLLIALGLIGSAVVIMKRSFLNGNPSRFRRR
jgi:hypothetical protein